jgi:hypothetical protein
MTGLGKTVRRFVVVAAACAFAATGLGASTASAAAPYCGIYWGSLDKHATATKVAPMTGVRAGRHACYDRLVIDVAARGANGFTVRYVSQVVQDGRGNVIPLRGGAKLNIVVQAPVEILGGHLSYIPVNRAELVNVSGFQTFRQVAWAGSFEGQSTIGLGVRARLPFRVFVLAGPGAGSRYVIDVAHHW